MRLSLRALTLTLMLATAVVGAAAADDPPVVVQKDRKFSATDLALPGPGSVVFANEDTVRHNISLRSPAGDTGTGVVQAPGDRTPVSFDKSGTYQVHCLIHPQMRMTVTVP